MTEGWSFGSERNALVMVVMCSWMAARLRLADCDGLRLGVGLTPAPLGLVGCEGREWRERRERRSEGLLSRE